jgi:hypothetical protein
LPRSFAHFPSFFCKGGLFLVDPDALLRFRTFEEFWSFCFAHCTDFKVGCAAQCPIRKKLEIPPFSKSYLGKMKGEIWKDAGEKI